MQHGKIPEGKQSKKRLALIHDTIEYGGLEIYIQMLLRHLDPERYSAVVVVPGYTHEYRSSPQRFIEEIEAMGVPILRPSAPKSPPGIEFLEDVNNIRQLLKSAKIDLIHTHTARPQGGRKASIAARLAGIKGIVRTEHLAASATMKRFTKYTSKPVEWLSDCIVVDSNANRDEQINLLGRKPEKIYRSYCGIELERFNPNHDLKEAKRQIGLDPELPVVGAVGRLATQKGHIYLVGAAARVLKEFGPVNFLLVGNGPLESQLKQQVAELGIGDHFHFAGFQANHIPYMEAMDITVMSSLHEGFSLSMLEFMAMGKPSVVTDHPSFLEAVVDQKSAIVVPMRSSDGLAEGILKVLNDPGLAANLGQTALERVRREFSIERLANDMMQLYDRVLGISPASSTYDKHKIASYS